jgi:hypothetical protein
MARRKEAKVEPQVEIDAIPEMNEDAGFDDE